MFRSNASSTLISSISVSMALILMWNNFRFTIYIWLNSFVI